MASTVSFADKIKNILGVSGPKARRATHAGGAEALRLVAPDGEGKKYGDDADGIVRRRTVIENVVLQNEKLAHNITEALPKEPTSIPTVDLFLPEALKNAYFVGHLVTDLDSVGGAIGAAELYGGKAVLASDVNSETAFALEKWGVDVPPKIEDMLKENSGANICLVDHQQVSLAVA